MGILGKEYICPELDCPNIKEGKKGQICPVCGTEYKKMASFQANNLRTFKQLNKKEQSNTKEEPKIKVISQNIPASNEMSDEEIKAKIYTEMDNLAMQEADIGWDKLETALSPNREGKMSLKTIIDQNKLIILQNELIYRELKRINGKSS